MTYIIKKYIQRVNYSLFPSNSHYSFTQQSFWNRGFVWRGTHICEHDFPTSLGFLLYSAIRRKTVKCVIILDSLHNRISNFTQVCVLIFLSLGCSFESWYNLNKKFWDILLYFPYKSMGSGNQHGGGVCDDLQNWLDMTSQENALLKQNLHDTSLLNKKCPRLQYQ